MHLGVRMHMYCLMHSSVFPLNIIIIIFTDEYYSCAVRFIACLQDIEIQFHCLKPSEELYI